MSEEIGIYQNGDETIESNRESSEDIKANLESDPKNIDAPEKDPEEVEAEEVSKAASELGKRGAQAKKEKAKEEPKEEPKAEEPEKEEKPNPRKDPTVRLRQVAREAAELKREKAELERRLAEVENRSRRPSGEPVEPQEADFKDPKKYAEALVDYQWTLRERAAEKEAQARKAQERQELTKRAIQKAWDEFDGRLQKAFADDPGFKDRTAEFAQDVIPSWELPPEKVTIFNRIADLIVQSEVGPQLMDYFAQNPDKYQEISEIENAYTLIKTVSKLEARLEASSETPTPVPVTSRAKPPISPIHTSPQTGDSLELSDDLSEDEWMRRRAALDKRRKRA